jgi:hypothetical protein
MNVIIGQLTSRLFEMLSVYMTMSEQFQHLLYVDMGTGRLSQWPSRLLRGSVGPRSLEFWVRIPRGHGCLSLVILVCCQAEVSATSRFLVQEIPTDPDV